MSHDPADIPVYAVLERTSPQFTALMVTEDGVTPIPGSILSTLTLTLYADDPDLTIVNARDHQNVLNTNGVTVYDLPQTDADGHQFNLRWIVSPADLAILNDALPFERHIALLEWTWPTNRAGKFELVLTVQNLAQVS